MLRFGMFGQWRSSLGWLRFSELWSDKAVMVRSGLFGYA